MRNLEETNGLHHDRRVDHGHAQRALASRHQAQGLVSNQCAPAGHKAGPRTGDAHLARDASRLTTVAA